MNWDSSVTTRYHLVLAKIPLEGESECVSHHSEGSTKDESTYPFSASHSSASSSRSLGTAKSMTRVWYDVIMT